MKNIYEFKKTELLTAQQILGYTREEIMKVLPREEMMKLLAKYDVSLDNFVVPENMTPEDMGLLQRYFLDMGKRFCMVSNEVMKQLFDGKINYKKVFQQKYVDSFWTKRKALALNVVIPMLKESKKELLDTKTELLDTKTEFNPENLTPENTLKAYTDMESFLDLGIQIMIQGVEFAEQRDDIREKTKLVEKRIEKQKRAIAKMYGLKGVK